MRPAHQGGAQVGETGEVRRRRRAALARVPAVAVYEQRSHPRRHCPFEVLEAPVADVQGRGWLGADS